MLAKASIHKWRKSVALSPGPLPHKLVYYKLNN